MKKKGDSSSLYIPQVDYFLFMYVPKYSGGLQLLWHFPENSILAAKTSKISALL